MRALVSVSGAMAAAALLSGCSAPIYHNQGPNPSANPPATILVRVVGVRDATEPEAVAIDGRALCHNYDPGRRKLPRCPRFDATAEGNRFVIETYVGVGEHRISVHGWGDDYVLKSDQLFLPGTVVTCEFDYKTVICTGAADGDVVAELEALGGGEAAEPPDLDAPQLDEAPSEEPPVTPAPVEGVPAESPPAPVEEVPP